MTSCLLIPLESFRGNLNQVSLQQGKKKKNFSLSLSLFFSFGLLKHEMGCLSPQPRVNMVRYLFIYFVTV